MAALIRTLPARLAAGALASLLSGCAAPLGPGYQLRRQTVAAGYLPASPGELRVRIEATVRNTGTRPLEFLEVRLPRLLPQAGSISAYVAGRQVTATPKGQQRILLALTPPLAQRHSQRLALTYALPAPAGSFVWEPGDWFATAVAPAGAFASGNRRAGHVRLSVTVPEGYRVFTTGRSLGVRRSAGQAEYRYEIQPTDFDPFLLVGRYDERTVAVARRQVMFWTLGPLDGACAQSLASHLSATSDLYRSLFGRIWKNPPPIPVIQVSGAVDSPIQVGAGRARSVGGGMLVDLRPSEICNRRDQFFQLADRALASAWFGWAVRPEPDARVVLGIGAADYAALAAGEQGGGPQARSRLVAEWLGEYARLRSAAKPLPPARLGDRPSTEQRRMAGIQAALGFVALDDRFGPQPVRRALMHLVGTLSGSTAGLDDLRSALEQETGENLYAFFQQWFGKPAIPPAFLDRYPTAQSGLVAAP